MSIKRPKLLNWLKFIGVTLFLCWAFYLQFFKSHPEAFTPWHKYTSTESPFVVVSYNDMGVVAETAPLYNAADPWNVVLEDKGYNSLSSKNITNEATTTKSKSKIKKLKVQINSLETYRKDLEKNISQLKNENITLSKITFEIQEKMMEFIEKNKIRDIITSAFIGALASLSLSYTLRKRSIRKKIDDFFWKNNF